MRAGWEAEAPDERAAAAHVCTDLASCAVIAPFGGSGITMSITISRIALVASCRSTILFFVVSAATIRLLLMPWPVAYRCLRAGALPRPIIDGAAPLRLAGMRVAALAR